MPAFFWWHVLLFRGLTYHVLCFPFVVQRLKKLKEYLKQHCEDAVRPHLDCVAGAVAVRKFLGPLCKVYA